MKKDIVAEFKKEPKPKQHLILAGLIAFVSTFLPWISVSFFGQTISTNAWNDVGYLTVIGSLALLLNWALPKLGIKYKLPLEEKLFEKIATGLIVAGPLFMLYQVRAEFGFIGLGLWIALVAGAYACYLTFWNKESKRKK